MCIAALWHSYKKYNESFNNETIPEYSSDLSNNDPLNIQQESKDFIFINKYLNSLSIILEIEERLDDDSDLLDDLEDKNDNLNKIIEERAKYVSVELLNDKEFITFAKKNNMQDALKLMEEVNEKNKKGN